MKRTLRLGLGLAAVAALVAAAPPRALSGVLGGNWDVSRDATGANATHVCIPEIEQLAQWEHRGKQCTRVVISDTPNDTVIHYTCTDGEFGRSQITVITPRSLRIDTQGISNNLPFHYQLYARRTGNCTK